MYVRTIDQLEWVEALAARSATSTEIARLTGIPRSTVRDWLNGRRPQHRPRPPGPLNDAEIESLSSKYAYLLGMYLGDGCLASHPRSVYRLRISLDAKYPGIIEECREAIAAVVPGNSVGETRRRSKLTKSEAHTIVEVHAYSKLWAWLFPQHGPGRKHERHIELSGWQWELVCSHPELMLRGLIHSDGCRFINTGTNWRHPRYSFSNRSSQILEIFEQTCVLIGVHCTQAPHTVYVSRKADVARLDEFIGPKR